MLLEGKLFPPLQKWTERNILFFWFTEGPTQQSNLILQFAAPSGQVHRFILWHCSTSEYNIHRFFLNTTFLDSVKMFVQDALKLWNCFYALQVVLLKCQKLHFLHIKSRVVAYATDLLWFERLENAWTRFLKEKARTGKSQDGRKHKSLN